MHDFKYRVFATAPIPNWGWELKDFRSESLRDVSDAFLANIIRTETFAKMPAYLSLMVQRNQSWTDYAIAKTGGEINPNIREYRELPPEVAKFAKPSVDKFVSSSRDEILELFDNVGIKYVERTLEFAEGIRVSMQALLSTVVLESWTAFETLASDLWVTAVDKGPKEVRLRVANSSRLLKPDDNIGPKELLDAEHDPSSNYGSSLRELGRVSFQKLDYIKRFYSIAFDYNFDKLFNEAEGGYITALSAFRNVLIHNSSKADKKFLKQVEPFPDFKQIAKDDSLALDGETVLKLRNSAMLLGQELIKFVDNILTPKAAI